MIRIPMNEFPIQKRVIPGILIYVFNPNNLQSETPTKALHGLLNKDLETAIDWGIQTTGFYHCDWTGSCVEQ